MTELSAEEQAKQDLLKKKSSMIAYHSLELCIIVVDSYQQKLERFERNIDNLEHDGVDKNVNDLWLSLRPTSLNTDHIALCKSATNLRLFLGKQCLPYSWKHPQTLESALREAGVSVQDITVETKRCEQYLEKTNDLSIKYSALNYHAYEVVYAVLSKKQSQGKILTPEEAKLFSLVGNILAEDH